MNAWLTTLLVTTANLDTQRVSALYNSLDPLSISQALAFHELYPDSEEGKKALARLKKWFNISSELEISSLTGLINRLQGVKEIFSEKDLQLIEKLAAHLPNRKLKGYVATREEEVTALPSDEIDLGKALILSQLNSDAYQARIYSAMLDLMALQILARLPIDATPLQKIQETNRFIFDEMHFRFPPQSVYAENIDLYTFLPSVMDNHLGVCLGVTALYLAIAQRIDLPLEIITPPGHIYIRYRDATLKVNIETTARGIDLPDETYLSVQNSKLHERTLKEVVGMTHVNQASTYLYKAEYVKAAATYEKALPYMPGDPLVRELLGYAYLFTEKKDQGIALLKGIQKGIHAIAEDFLAGKVDLEGIEAAFMLVDENRDSILAKQKRLEAIIKKYPDFRDGLHQLAITWIQLNRSREAITALTHCYDLDPTDVVAAYYLAVLHGQREDFKKCWYYLKQAEALTCAENFIPQTLKDLRQSLLAHYPET